MKLKDLEDVGALVVKSIQESGIDVNILTKILSLKGGQREKVLSKVVEVFEECVEGHKRTMYLVNSKSPPHLELNLH
ncbi:MAG TPA: hypothetical protein VK675_01695 [Candidatus Paceibacterota bacterium]|nr:hypothetical protein [Candidatus Paceibacterota bacterium]